MNALSLVGASMMLVLASLRSRPQDTGRFRPDSVSHHGSISAAADHPHPGRKPAPALPVVMRLPQVCQSRRRKGPRSREETEEDRRRLEEEMTREIDRLVEEYHAQVPMAEARAVGAIYARYSSRFQHSIADQVRSLYEAAVREKIYVPRAHVFFDLAVRGCKERRPGLQQLSAVLASRAVQVLLVFTTNRLYRKTYKALQFVEEKVVGRGIRCLFVKSGVDSADEKRWRMLLQFHAMTDEFVSGMYADNVRAAHEGLFDRALVWGTLTFGYRAQPIEGEKTQRQLPRCRYEVDPETATWVRQVLHWFVVNLLPIKEIVRRLNSDPAVPLGPKSVSGRWTYQAVRLLLSNPRYRGWWAYGKTRNVWQNEGDYTRQVPRSTPLREQQFEELRIVPDALWYEAQKRLAEEPRGAGRKPTDGERKSRPKLLNGFFYCPEHNRRLHVGGVKGRFMVCPVCQGLPADKRPLFSQLNRVLALQRTCHMLAKFICLDESLVEELLEACRQEVARCQQPDPTRLKEMRARHERLSQQIQFVLDNAGENEVDRQEAQGVLRRLRAERAHLAADIAQLEGIAQRAVVLPTAEEVEELLGQMGTILRAAGQSDDDEEVGQVRQVVKLLTGGRIDLVQQGERKAQRGWLQGRFRLQLLNVVVAEMTGLPPTSALEGVEIVIDYREPSEAEKWADRVKELYDGGLLIKAIAARLGITRNLARKALACWYKRQGQEMPDGRSRRAELAQKHLEPPPYQALADRAMELYDRKLPMGKIAEELGCDRNTLTKAVAFGHAARGLQPPDGRTRRKMLKQQQPGIPEAQGAPATDSRDGEGGA